MQEEAASFTLMGGLRPFQKARVCSLGPRRLAQPSRLFFMSLTKVRWMGRELLTANSYCETRWVYQRSLLASPSVLEVERSRQETTDWFCCKHACISEFTECVSHESGHLTYLSPYSQYLLPFISVQRLHGDPIFWNWPTAPCFGWPKWGLWTALDSNVTSSIWSPCVLAC